MASSKLGRFLPCDEHEHYWTAVCLVCEVGAQTRERLEREKLLRDALRYTLIELVGRDPKFLESTNRPVTPAEEYVTAFIKGEV